MVRRVKQLKVLSRVKRDYRGDHSSSRRRRSRRRHNFGDEIKRHRRRRKRMTKFNIQQGPNDPLYGNMWYINPGKDHQYCLIYTVIEFIKLVLMSKSA